MNQILFIYALLSKSLITTAAAVNHQLTSFTPLRVLSFILFLPFLSVLNMDGITQK